jgi:putative zinc finger/helix-turn-helix YgiT family protein
MTHASGLCSACGCLTVEGATATVSVELLEPAVSVTVSVPARRCPRCETVLVDEAVRTRSHLAASSELADLGVHTGDSLRHMRKALGLRAADLARLLDVRPETISHWETGKAPPNRAAFAALAAMVEDALDGRTTTRDRLARLADERPFPRNVAVKLR